LSVARTVAIGRDQFRPGEFDARFEPERLATLAGV
jgi:hypothetical protein